MKKKEVKFPHVHIKVRDDRSPAFLKKFYEPKESTFTDFWSTPNASRKSEKHVAHKYPAPDTAFVDETQLGRNKHDNGKMPNDKPRFKIVKVGKRKVKKFDPFTAASDEKLANVTVTQNYDLTRRKTIKLRTGKNKGEEVEIELPNNPIGKRYKRHSEINETKGNMHDIDWIKKPK